LSEGREVGTNWGQTRKGEDLQRERGGSNFKVIPDELLPRVRRFSVGEGFSRQRNKQNARCLLRRAKPVEGGMGPKCVSSGKGVSYFGTIGKGKGSRSTNEHGEKLTS